MSVLKLSVIELQGAISKSSSVVVEKGEQHGPLVGGERDEGRLRSGHEPKLGGFPIAQSLGPLTLDKTTASNGGVGRNVRAVNRVAAAVRSVTKGRMLRRGLTWTSGTIGLIVIAGGLIGLSSLVQRYQTRDFVELAVVGQQIEADGAACVWVIDFEVTSTAERNQQVMSAELDKLEGSRKGSIAIIEPFASVVRTYRFPLPDCSTDPFSLDPGRLRVRYKPAGSSFDLSRTADIT